MLQDSKILKYFLELGLGKYYETDKVVQQESERSHKQPDIAMMVKQAEKEKEFLTSPSEVVGGRGGEGVASVAIFDINCITLR